MKRYSIFQIAYIAGITVGVAAAVGSLLGGPAVGERVARSLFWIGVGHLALICLLAIGLPSTLRQAAGNKIQTAGYLHTLIGFSTILILLGQAETFSTALVLGPLGSALITSIVGWFVGGELTGRADPEPVSVAAEAERVASELSGFASAVRRAHEDYIRAVGELTAGYGEIDRRHKEALENAGKIAGRVTKSVEKVEGTVRSLEATLAAAAKTLSEAFTAEFVTAAATAADTTGDVAANTALLRDRAKEAADYLAEARVLIDELEQVVHLVVGERSAAH